MNSHPAGTATRALIAAAVSFLVSGASLAQTAPPAPPPMPAYHPSMGDLMTIAVQPRHIKLGIAGKARNWAYAAYEADELKNAFDRIARTIPAYRNADVGGLVGADMGPRIAALAATIKARDGHGFDRAFAQVTDACNSCHRALDHAFVVITVPALSPYADQRLAPAR